MGTVRKRAYFRSMAEGVARGPSPADAISRQEALERFETLNSSVERIFNMLSSQGFSAAAATASGSSANSGACTSGAEQEGHTHPASAPSFLQVSQDSVSAVLPAQRSFANLAHSQSNFLLSSPTLWFPLMLGVVCR